MSYIVNFTNNSANTGYACIFQQDSNIGVQGVLPLAWLSVLCDPSSTAATFNWDTTFCFFWGVPYIPPPQASPYYHTYGILSANVTGTTLTNQVTLDYNGAFQFTNQTAGAAPNNLYITQDGTIPAGEAYVGIGMDGAGTFVVPATENTSLMFTPNLTPTTYYVTFGPYPQGAVLNLEDLTIPPLEITFPAGENTATVVLQNTNTWATPAYSNT